MTISYSKFWDDIYSYEKQRADEAEKRAEQYKKIIEGIVLKVQHQQGFIKYYGDKSHLSSVDMIVDIVLEEAGNIQKLERGEE
ncbi:hypothetical protein [Macrococcus brunensis]|uniref:hypothetical protein n=1 Tax=Macrococcus brunensis TaxID=198483 RepID=UPI001EEF7E46|nr:hypothetical protein [Macrococcus brunensis]ULG73004.1 hypothetical protein MGG12_05665 [Macrococcus brunensis]